MSEVMHFAPSIAWPAEFHSAKRWTNGARTPWGWTHTARPRASTISQKGWKIGSPMYAPPYWAPMLATFSPSSLTARSSSPSARFKSWSGSTKLPTKRRGNCVAHSVVLSFERMHSSRSCRGSAQEVPCSTVLALTTLTSMPRASMSSISSFGSNILCMSCAAPGRGAGIGFAPKPVNTVLLVEALNTPSSSMWTWKSTTSGRSCVIVRLLPRLFSFRLQPDLPDNPAPAQAFGADKVARRLRRQRAVGVDTDVAQARGIVEDPAHLPVEAPHRLRRRSGGRDESEPAHQVEPGEGLGGGGDILVARRPLRCSQRERAQIAALEKRSRGGNGDDHQLGAAGDRGLDPP